MSLKPKDYWLIGVSTLIGMTLVFVLLSTDHNTVAHTIIGVTAGLVLLAIGFGVVKPNLRRNRREILEVFESAAIPRDARVEITFEPDVTLRNPRLSLNTLARDVMVDEVWFHDRGSLQSPQDIALWNRGVYYRGIVSKYKKLTVLISNNGTSTANIVARLVGYKDKE
jgi:hypothetical protein